MPVKSLDLKNILLIVGSIGIVFFMLNFKQLFSTDTDIIGYFIYGAMILMQKQILLAWSALASMLHLMPEL